MKTEPPKWCDECCSKADSGDNGICQNPLLASSIENKFAPVNWANTCSITGSGCRSLQSLSFSLVKSTQIRTKPLAF